MTDRFVRSLAAGAATGADWANAFLTLTAANTASAAGDRFWIADDHAESTAGAVRLASKGTSASPNFYYCVDHTVASPGAGDLKTTATITDSTNSNFDIDGFAYYYGISFIAGAGGATAGPIRLSVLASSSIIFEACLLWMNGTNSQSFLFGTGTTNRTNRIWLNNTALKFGATGQNVNFESSAIKWTKTASGLQGTIPTTLFTDTGFGNNVSTVLIDGVDLSGAGAGKTLVGTIAQPAVFQFVRCQLGASVVVAATPTARGGGQIDVIQCDSGATNYLQQRYWYEGTLTQETTIVRSGGASDGTTPLSWKVVTTPNSKWLWPFECFAIAIWNDTINTPVTATIEFAAAGSLNTDDVWPEGEYLGSALTPQASFASGTKANNLATGTAWPSSAATWASSPGSPQKMAVTFTPQMKGYLYVRVYVAKASQTLYVDPRPSFNGIPVRRSYISINGVFMAEPAVSRPGLHPIEMGIAA